MNDLAVLKRCWACRAGVPAIAKLFFVLVLMLVLSACAGKAPLPAGTADVERRARLQNLDAWVARGRMSVSDGEDGGQARFIWQQLGDRTVVQLMGPVAQGTWRLEVTPDMATLRDSKGNSDTAARPEPLLDHYLGWSIPIEALGRWLLGSVGPDASAVQHDDQARPVAFEDLGWQVHYKGYQQLSGLDLPSRIDVRREQYEARVLLSGWRLIGEG